MQCPRCQAINDDGAAYCSRCGSQMGQGAPVGPAAIGPVGPSYAQGGAPFKDYMTGSILVTVFCCWPLGIPAIVFASKARKMNAAGDLVGAQNAAGTAKTLLWIGLGVGLVVQAILIIILASNN